METVQLECGTCRRVMAVSLEDLGGQVYCPHCQAIVETPASPAGAPGREAGSDTESIFAGPEAADDIFGGGPAGPRVEMPLEPFHAPVPDALAQGPSARRHGAIADPPAGHEPVTEGAVASTPRSGDSSPHYEGARHLPDNPAADDTFAAISTRRAVSRSALAPILLIFLVPYALLATGVIAYLYVQLQQNRAVDPLERLPDPNPKPKEGGPRTQERVKHDVPLPVRLKTRLREPLQIGALQVTPLKVQWVGDELILHLKMKNISRDLVFNPLSKQFLKDTGGVNRPYTYLDWSGNKIYGGIPEWLQGPDGQEVHFGGDIGPGQEALIRIITAPKYKEEVRRLAKSRETLLWRVQVRRGFVEVRGDQVSATAVVGVEFSAGDISKEG